MDKPHSGYRLALATTLLAACVVVLGAYTRLVDAGLGCPDWPGCYGFLSVPQTPEAIAVAEQRYPDAPVEVQKGWPEMIHRYVAGVLGLLVLALAFNSVAQHRRRPSPDLPRPPCKLPLLLLVLVVCQALFGMWTVTLKLWPQVVTVHLLGGFTILSLACLLTLRLRNRPWTVPVARRDAWHRLRRWTLLGLLLVVLQVALGGWMSANYAALACPDLPTCQSQWWPPMNFAQGFDLTQDIGPNYLGGLLENDARVAIHVSHRLGALLLTGYLAWLATRLLRQGRGSVLGSWGLALGALLVIQVGLGISNIVWRLPLPVAVAHNAGGAALVVALVVITYRLWTVQALPREAPL